MGKVKGRNPVANSLLAGRYMGGSSSKKNPLGLSDVDVECFKATFDAFDVDGGGSIDAAELKGLLNAFGVTPTDEELETMIHEVDEDGSGEIEFEEFLRMVVLRMERNMMGDKHAAKLAFDVFDEKETGEVDSEELRNCLIRAKGVELGPDEVN